MRNKKISADISEDAKTMLDAYAVKHERSKGWLLDKMIRKFCVETPEHEKPSRGTVVTTSVNKPKRKVFAKPTPLEVDGYMVERGINDPNEAQTFHDFYESKGWVVGKVKMKCWKAAVRNWMKGYKEKTGGKDILQKSAESNWHLEDQGF